MLDNIFVEISLFSFLFFFFPCFYIICLVICSSLPIFAAGKNALVFPPFEFYFLH